MSRRSPHVSAPLDAFSYHLHPHFHRLVLDPVLRTPPSSRNKPYGPSNYRIFPRFLAYDKSCTPEIRIPSHLLLPPHSDSNPSRLYRRGWIGFRSLSVTGSTCCHTRNLPDPAETESSFLLVSSPPSSGPCSWSWYRCLVLVLVVLLYPSPSPLHLQSHPNVHLGTYLFSLESSASCMARLDSYPWFPRTSSGTEAPSSPYLRLPSPVEVSSPCKLRRRSSRIASAPEPSLSPSLLSRTQQKPFYRWSQRSLLLQLSERLLCGGVCRCLYLPLFTFLFQFFFIYFTIYHPLISPSYYFYLFLLKTLLFSFILIKNNTHFFYFLSIFSFILIENINIFIYSYFKHF